MLQLILLMSICSGIPSLVLGDEPQILGEISRGKPKNLVDRRVNRIEKGELIRETILNQDGRKVTYQELTDESLLEISQATPADQPKIKELLQAHYSVWARQFAEGKTFVQWWNGPEKYSAWSSLNFEDFEGFTSFEKDGVAFSFMLFRGEGNLEELVSHDERSGEDKLSVLSTLKAGSPSFILVSELAETDQARIFFSGLHKIAETRGDDLREATKQRAQRLEKLRRKALAEPNQKEDVVFRYKVKVGPPAQQK